MPEWNPATFRDLLLSAEDTQNDLNEVVDVVFGDKVAIVEVVTEVCKSWKMIAKSFSQDHQNLCLWRMIGLPLFIGNVVPEVPVPMRIEFIKAAKEVTLAIPLLTPDEEPMQNGYFMWWDCLAKIFVDKKLKSICLATLSDLLEHEDIRVSYAALHGLGHLQHPDRASVVDAYIRRVPGAADDPWVLECRNGTVM